MVTSEESELVAYTHTAQCGLSATTMAMAALGVAWQSYPPQNPLDLEQCIDLVERFPIVRRRMDVVGSLGAKWSRIVMEWDRLVALYANDRSGVWKRLDAINQLEDFDPFGGLEPLEESTQPIKGI